MCCLRTCYSGLKTLDSRLPTNPYLARMNTFFDRLANFFAALTPETTSLLIILGLLLFMFGLVLGWLIQRRATQRVGQQVALFQSERDAIQVARARLEEERNTLARELEIVSTEKVAAVEEVQELNRELEYRSQMTQTLEKRVDELESTNQTLSATVESLNDQVIGLKTQNERLRFGGQGSEVAFGADAGAPLVGEEQSEHPAPGEEGVPFEFPAAAPPAGTGDQGATGLERRLQYLEDRLATLAERQSFPSAPSPDATYRVGEPGQPTEVDERDEPLVIRADVTEPGIRYGQRGEAEVVVSATPSLQPPAAAEREALRDDLTAIKQIGPFLQDQLNQVDVYRYEQIASWGEANVTSYTELIGYLPGMIERDDWVGQARRLTQAATTGETEADHPAPTAPSIPAEAGGAVIRPSKLNPLPPDPAPAAAPPDPAAADNNLRVVEGIGPRISTLLRENGIDTLSKLAATSTEDLRYMLDTAGGSFRQHNPDTWIAQAEMASQGKLEALRDWQNELKGGL